MNAREIRSGCSAACGLGLAVGLTFLSGVSAHAGELTTLRSQKAAGQVKSSWSPERLRAARPLPVPAAAFDRAADAGAAVDEAAAGSGRSVSAPGQLPRPGIRPLRSNRLFDPAGPASGAGASLQEIGDRSVGSTGSQFTSHRLIPAEADLEYPYSTVGILFFHIPGEGDFYCSGAVLRRRIVVTAGQCLHQGSGGDSGYFEDFLFVPAFRGGDAPFGAWEAAFVSIPTPWFQGNGRLPHATDFGFLEMEDQVFDGQLLRIGDVTGTLGFVTRKLRPNHATLLGYPENFDGGNRMHQVTSKDFKATSASTNTVEYGSDMRGGSQGGPLIQDFGDNLSLVKLIGVLSYFPSSTRVKTEGASIPDNRFSSILAAVCADRAGNC